MKRLLIIALTLLHAVSANADAPGPNSGPGPPQYVVHNGSLMLVTPLPGGLIQITYVQPRPNLYGLVGPGTLLLRGQWQAGQLVATAFVFPPPPCPPVPYTVTGGVDPRNGVLIVAGPAPLIDPYVCAVVGMIWSNNSTLAFYPQH